METKPETINDENVNKNFEETKLICKLWNLCPEKKNLTDNYYNWASIIELTRYCKNKTK